MPVISHSNKLKQGVAQNGAANAQQNAVQGASANHNLGNMADMEH